MNRRFWGFLAGSVALAFGLLETVLFWSESRRLRVVLAVAIAIALAGVWFLSTLESDRRSALETGG